MPRLFVWPREVDLSDPSNLDELAQNLVSSSKMTTPTPKLSELLGLMQKAREERLKVKTGDCVDPEKDCADLVSPCCSAPLRRVFGTLPLRVVCSGCQKEHLLRDLIRASLKT